GQLMLVGDGVVEGKGIHVASGTCAPLAAILRVPGSSSSIGDDVMTLLPEGALGLAYLPDTGNGAAELAVVATQDGTRVRWENPHCPGPVDVVLDRGEALQQVCDDDPATATERGVDGTRVEAD